MEVIQPSTKSVDVKEQRVDIVSRRCWEEAIAYGEQLLVEVEGKRQRARLMAAIEHFKYRLDSGADYPGI